MSAQLILTHRPSDSRSGGVEIRVRTGAQFVGEYSASTKGYEYFQEVPHSFIEALADFHAGRVVNLDQALNEPPPDDV
jgi:hypothetical protein